MVVARPNKAKEAWDILTNIVKDNKRTHASTLKTELRSIQLGTLSMEAYFQKIESLVTTLTSLDCVVNDEDVVHYAITGLPEKYAQEVRLKTKEVALPADSFSPMILMAQTGTNSQPFNPQIKSWRPCFNFTKGSCRFGSEYKYVHDSNAKHTSNVNPRMSSTNNTEELLVKLLDKLGLNNTSSNATDTDTLNNTPSANHVSMHRGPNVTTSSPTANLPYYTYPIQSIRPTPSTSQMIPTNPTPFYYPPGVGSVQGLTSSQPGTSGSVATPGHATLLPQALLSTLHDPNTGASNMDTEKLVSWSSKKQDCTAMSSEEAEYVSLSACCVQVIWMRTQLLDYGFRYNKIPIYCDSQSAIAISCNPVQHSRTKHINIRYHFIKKHVEKSTIELYFVGTEYQLADLFTKALPKERFEILVHKIGIRCMTPTQLERLAKLSS
ncbi:retrovirus-related pol polyprotein from transposon TNT 1-94 [Tanacetum coccineum]